jgi:hypothetical protein
MEAVVSICNVPSSTSDFVVEVSRFTWHHPQVLLDGNVIVDFPQVTIDTTSLGYAPFHVTPSYAIFEKLNKSFVFYFEK